MRFPAQHRFWNPQGVHYQMVISWQFSTLFHSNIQHIRKQVCLHDAKIYHRFLFHTWSVPSVLVNVCLWAEKRYSWCGVRWYNRVHQIPSVLIQTQNSMPSNLTLPCFHVCSNVCVLKSLMRTVDSEGDTVSRAAFTSSTKAWYSLTALEVYTCIMHIDWFSTLSFNMQTHDPKGIQSDTQSANWGLVSRHNWISSRIEQLPLAIQVHSSRATSLG